MDPRRLCHISDLPNSLHFLPIEIKHLLPVHHPKFIDNLHTIIANQSRLLNWNVYPDLSLTLSNSQYMSVSGGWCEDIDGQQQHLKSSLELSAIILNYLYSHIQTLPSEEEQLNTTALQRMDHIGCDPRPRNLRLSTVLAYNIYKTKDKEQKTKFIFLMAQQKSSTIKLYSLLAAVRYWNLHRLKADTCQKIIPSRFDKQMEHLLHILRGFLPLDETDHQSQKKQLQHLVGWIQDGQMPKSVPRSGIEADQEVMLSRFQLTHKSNLQQKDLLHFGVYVISNLLSILPINISCSFTGRSFYYPQQNQIVLIWMSCYKKIPNLVYADSPAVQQAVKQGCSFLRQKIVETIKDSSTNIADQMLKNSLKVLSKYTPGQEKNRYKQLNNLNQSSRVIGSRLDSSILDDKNKNIDFDRMSVISKISFKNTLSEQGRDGRARAEAQFQSLSTPLKAHRDRQYAQLLANIEGWQSIYGKVTSFDQVKLQIKRNCERGKLRYQKQNLTTNESKLLQSLVAIRHYLEVNQFLLLLKYHTEEKQAFFQVLFQISAGNFLIQLGKKIAKQYARDLYQTYITKDFKVEINSLMIHFMKKMIIKFCKDEQLYQIGNEINIPLLIQLLQKQSVRGPIYKQFTKEFLDKLFFQNSKLAAISPFLNQIYIFLISDHHQELVHSLLADLAFEAIYFSYDLGQINNSPYRKEQGLRKKKVLQLVRTGGFSSFGFQIKKILMPLISQNSNFVLSSAFIYQEIIITRPLLMSKFIQIITQSHVTQHLTQLIQFFKFHLYTANTVTRPISNAFLCSQIKKFSWELEPNVSFGSFKSQSGIFNQLLEYNPQIKIAGRSLSEVIRSHQAEKWKKYDKFEAEYILTNELKLNLQEIYELILIVLKLKEKYERYESLSEDERIYLRQIVHKVLGRKDELLQYLTLSGAIKLFNGLEAQSLF